MATAITVLYPNVDDATFDMDYYLGRHMPLVAARFGPYGMTGWRVARFVGTPSGGASPFSVVATLEFGSGEAFKSALTAEGGVVMGDVPHFTNTQPTLMIGEVVGHG